MQLRNSVKLTFLGLDKERDIELRTASIQNELADERAHQARLSSEISQLQRQLQEAKNGLMAAARLSDQMELNQHTIERLNNESKFVRRQLFGFSLFRFCQLI